MTNQVVIQDERSGCWLHFREPCRVVEAWRTEEVVPALRQVEELVAAHGWHAAGFLSYEAAPAFDRALRVRPLDSFPLAWFGLYSRPERHSRLGEIAPRDREHSAPTLSSPPFASLRWTPSIGREAYAQAIADIKRRIAAGETYQVNYTFRLRAPFAGDAWSFFLELGRAQQARHMALVDTGRFAVLSASPELFFRLDGRRLTSRPMKGTASRHRIPEDDDARGRELGRSSKNRAENVMIVDMIRNDMGRVAEVGSVRVPQLFEVERYPTLWQMTSTVTAASDASVTDILRAMFPCASVTGAPKPRTMQIIASLETTPRGVYTGAIGFIAPQRRAEFNVAIRTVMVDRLAARAEFGVGGGIVWDSTTGGEYEECHLKARVLFERRPPFSLLETMLWTPAQGYFLLPYHLRRLRDSAAYFGFPADMPSVGQKLARLATTLAASPSRRPHKVRLLVAEDGESCCEAAPAASELGSRPVRLRLAPAPVPSDNLLLAHKTTHRQIYDAARAACPGGDDVLLWNERGEITETSIANVVADLDGELVTPPLASGLLPGTFRAWLLDLGKVRERRITGDMLRRSRRVYVVSSVRKWQEAVVEWGGAAGSRGL